MFSYPSPRQALIQARVSLKEKKVNSGKQYQSERNQSITMSSGVSSVSSSSRNGSCSTE